MAMMRTGIAYHGNRMLSHVREDMRDIIEHNCTYVVHMFSENDYVRHHEVLKDIVRVTHEYGLESWIDSWGMGRIFAGEVSGWLADFPDSREVLNDGTPVAKACLYSQDYRKALKGWTDAALATESEVVFWDEPHLAFNQGAEGQPPAWGCRCPRCQAIFRDTYGYEMPTELTDDVIDFRHKSALDFFTDMTKHVSERGKENCICLMPARDARYGDKNWDDFAAIPTVDILSTDPYWYGGRGEVTSYVSEWSKRLLDVCARFNKRHQIWIQAFAVPAGREIEIVQAAEAAYATGVRDLAAWGFRGSEANDYRAQRPDITWQAIGEAFRRVLWRW
jgi:hypothetical protein